MPTASALALYRAVLANRPTADGDSNDLGVEADCPACGAPVEAHYDQEFLSIDCQHCSGWWGLHYPFPRNGLAGRTGTELFDALTERALYHVGLARTGQCPVCAGHTTVDIDEETLDGEDVPTVTITCETCSWVASIDMVSALRFEPRVMVLVNDLRGQTHATATAKPGETSQPTDVTGKRREDGTVALTFRAGGRTATVVVDDGLSVVTAEGGSD